MPNQLPEEQHSAFSSLLLGKTSLSTDQNTASATRVAVKTLLQTPHSSGTSNHLCAMEEEASRTEPSSATGSTQALEQPKAENNADMLIPSFTPSSVPSPPTPTSTLSRLGLKSPTSPTGAVPGSPIDRGQVSAITVVALLDKLVNMMETVQDNQQRMEQRQADLEGAVRVVQGDVTRLSKTHVSTSNSVSKLLERSRKVSDHLKEVRERLDKQAVQVKKLEANHSHLLKRNHFKVLIFQVRVKSLEGKIKYASKHASRLGSAIK